MSSVLVFIASVARDEVKITSQERTQLCKMRLTAVWNLFGLASCLDVGAYPGLAALSSTD